MFDVRYKKGQMHIFDPTLKSVDDVIGSSPSDLVEHRVVSSPAHLRSLIELKQGVVQLNSYLLIKHYKVLVNDLNDKSLKISLVSLNVH